MEGKPFWSMKGERPRWSTVSAISAVSATATTPSARRLNGNRRPILPRPPTDNRTRQRKSRRHGSLGMSGVSTRVLREENSTTEGGNMKCLNQCRVDLMKLIGYKDEKHNDEIVRVFTYRCTMCGAEKTYTIALPFKE